MAGARRPDGPATGHVAQCDALRGLAILLVVLFHAHQQLPKDQGLRPGLLSSFVLAGNTGVTLFFVLSAFLLNLPWMSGGPIEPGRFYRNRVLRIMPMYALAVALGGLWNRDLATALRSLCFVDIGIATLWPFGAVWWSLVPEVQFYAVLPWLHVLGRSVRLRWLLLPVFALACVAYARVTGSSGGFGFLASPRDSLLARWPAFACGAALAAIHARRGDRLRASCRESVLGRGVAAEAVTLAPLLVLAVLLREDARVGAVAAHLRHFHRVAAQAVAWTAVVAACLYVPSRLAGLLSNRLFVSLGLVSFSLYLLHCPALVLVPAQLARIPWVGTHLSAAGVLAVCLALSLAVSTITYRYVEKPMLALKAR